MYLSISFGKSTPPQDRQLKISISNSKHQVDDFCGGVDFLKLMNDFILRDKGWWNAGAAERAGDLEVGRGYDARTGCEPSSSSSSLLLSSQELSDTHVYESCIRARLGTASHSCEVVVLESRTAPKCTTKLYYVLPRGC